MSEKIEKKLALLREFEPAVSDWFDDLRVPQDEPMRLGIEFALSRLIEVLELVKEEKS